MVTIQNLEVRFDVEGDGDAEVFTRMFNAHIRRWQHQDQDRRASARLSAAERSLGDHHGGREDM
jgi:hypothetical protein